MSGTNCKRCNSIIYFTKDAQGKWQPFDDIKYKNHHFLSCADGKPKYKIGQILKFNVKEDGSLRICKVEDIKNISGASDFYLAEPIPENCYYTTPYYVVRYLYKGKWLKGQKTLQCRSFDKQYDSAAIENEEMVTVLYG